MSQVVGRQVWWPQRGIATIEDLTVRAPGRGEVLVEVSHSLFNAGSETAFLYGLENTPSEDTSATPLDETASGMRAGWALHGWQSGDDFFPRAPEAGSVGGVVVGVGSEVVRAKVGDRVQVSTYPHASHAIVDEDRLNWIPNHISIEEALFIAPAHVALFGNQKAALQLGESVVVVGLGQIGQCAVQFARLGGARPVIAIDPIARRRDLASALGADHVIDPTVSDVTSAVHALTLGEGAAVVIDASGSPGVLPTDFRIARRFGRVVIVGAPRGATANVNFYTDIMWKNLFVMGAHVTGGAPDVAFHLVPWQFGLWTAKRQRELIVDLLSRGDMDARTMLNDTVRMAAEDVQEAYRFALEERDKALNVIMDWTQCTT